MVETPDLTDLTTFFAEIRQPREPGPDRAQAMYAGVKACKNAGWSYTLIGQALALSTERARQMAAQYDGRDVGQLPPVPVPPMPQKASPPAAEKTVDEALRRVRAAGWEPAEPYPGMLTDFWRLQCSTCGHEERRKPVPKMVRCRHLTARREEEHATQERQAVVTARQRKLTTKNLRALEDYPGAGLLWLVQCKFCKRTWRMPEDALRACPHKGAGDGGTLPPRRPGDFPA